MSTSVEQLLDNIRQYAITDLKSISKQFDQDETYPQEYVEQLLSMEILHLLIEGNQYEGSFVDFLRIIRIVSKHFAALGSILLTQGTYGLLPIYQFGSDKQKEKYLSDLLSGQIIASFAVNELESGSFIENIRTTATKNENGWVITGEKCTISNLPVADIVYVVAKITDTQAHNDTVGIFIVDTNAKGVSIGKTELKMGIKALPVANVTFDQVQVTSEDLLGEHMNGSQQFEWIMNRQRLAIAAQSVGIAQGAMEGGIKYVTYDRRFGQRLIDLQNTQLKLAEAQTKIDATRAFLLRVEQDFIDDTRKVSMAKLLASDTAIETTETILQVTGGYAYMRNNEIERFVRDAKITAIYGGSSATQKRIISLPWIKKNKEE